MAKIGATGVSAGSPQSRLMLQFTSRAFLKRSAAEKKRRESSNWWKQSIADSRGYLERKTPNFRPELHRTPKELASRFYQLMMGHAVIAPYLKYKIKTSDSDECWWCEIPGKRQTREHLFKECIHWKDEIKRLWKRVEKDVGWRHYRHKPISALFNEVKATDAILAFLDKTRVGKLRGGLRVDEDDEGVEVEEEEEDAGNVVGD
jgi:hypothetical protein